MNPISLVEIGSRISNLRKSKGYSQNDLAKLLKISRPSLTQIELGKRNLSAIELKKISDNLSISIDKLLSSDFKIDTAEFELDKEEKNQELRISVPKLKVYFSDFNYYEIYQEHLSGAEYRKLPFGPVPQRINSIINQMISGQMIQRVKTKYHGYPQTRYIPLVKPNLMNLKASEKDVIDKVIELYSDWSASAISEYSHKDMPWLASKDGEVIDYELAFYREAPYSVRVYND